MKNHFISPVPAILTTISLLHNRTGTSFLFLACLGFVLVAACSAVLGTGRHRALRTLGKLLPHKEIPSLNLVSHSPAVTFQQAQNHLEGIKCKLVVPSPESQSQRSGQNLRAYMSTKHPGNVDAAGPGTTPEEPDGHVPLSGWSAELAIRKGLLALELTRSSTKRNPTAGREL